MIVFEAWEEEGEITFSTQENVNSQRKSGLLSNDAKLLYQIEASDYNQAMILHHEKMGWEAYKPMKDI